MMYRYETKDEVDEKYDYQRCTEVLSCPVSDALVQGKSSALLVF